MLDVVGSWEVDEYRNTFYIFAHSHTHKNDCVSDDCFLSDLDMLDYLLRRFLLI